MLFWGWAYELFGVFDTLPDAASVVAALQLAGTEAGTYFVPWPKNTPETFAQFVAQHTTGPFFQLSYSREGSIRKRLVRSRVVCCTTSWSRCWRLHCCGWPRRRPRRLYGSSRWCFWPAVSARSSFGLASRSGFICPGAMRLGT